MNDVCLLLEGTYPYVAGGVSTWVYDLIKRLPDKTFSIVYLGAHRQAAKKMHYEIPSNVVDFRENYLFDYFVEKEKGNAKPGKHDYRIIEEFLVAMRQGDTSHFNDLLRTVGDRATRSIDLYDLAHSRQGWEIVEKLYLREDPEVSFIDYFWTWRFLYLPFFSLLRTDIPPSSVYHCASTGYAGVLGVMGKLRYKRPLILTEHGIYTRERKMEISRADWIYSDAVDQLKVREGGDFFKQWWIDVFSFFSRLAYLHADEIITLYDGNRKIQIEEGAPAVKTKIMPNGVEFNQLSSLPRQKSETDPWMVGFAGRVVPIKDVKTFIVACRRIYEELKNVRFLIMGPTDEDEEYYHECVLLAQMESIGDAVIFTGKIDLKEYYPKLDVLVLTSISEAQPIVILEAGACGLPVVATNVGACAELLYGGSPDDRLLGASGVITPICNPEATAQAVIRILRDRALSKQMGEIGKKRIGRYYQMDDMIANYQKLYTQYGEKMLWLA